MLYYPSRRRLPGEDAGMTGPLKMANTIQQVKMCQGFSEAGEEVCYVSPKNGNETPSWERISAYFGLSTRFDLKTISAPAQRYNFPNYPVPNTDDQLIFCWLGYKYLFGGFDDGDIVFSRTLPAIRYFLQFRDWFWGGPDISVWFEQHQIDRGVSDKMLGERFYEQLDGVVCISEKQKQAIVDTQPVDPEKIVVAHDGVDLGAYEGMSTGEARERLGVDPDEQVVMYTGHLYPAKGVETLVRAAADFDAHCWIIGGYEEDISRIRAEVAIPDNVTFEGFVPPAEIPVYQLAADVLVVTAAPDGTYFSPLKLFEYMAAGKPIVASRKREFEEVLTDGKNAVFVEPGSVVETAEAVARLLSDPQQRTALGRQARDDAKQYGWRTRARRILDAIQEDYRQTSDDPSSVGRRATTRTGPGSEREPKEL